MQVELSANLTGPVGKGGIKPSGGCPGSCLETDPPAFLGQIKRILGDPVEESHTEANAQPTAHPSISDASDTSDDPSRTEAKVRDDRKIGRKAPNCPEDSNAVRDISESNTPKMKQIYGIDAGGESQPTPMIQGQSMESVGEHGSPTQPQPFSFDSDEAMTEASDIPSAFQSLRQPYADGNGRRSEMGTSAPFMSVPRAAENAPSSIMPSELAMERTGTAPHCAGGPAFTKTGHTEAASLLRPSNVPAQSTDTAEACGAMNAGHEASFRWAADLRGGMTPVDAGGSLTGSENLVSPFVTATGDDPGKISSHFSLSPVLMDEKGNGWQSETRTSPSQLILDFSTRGYSVISQGFPDKAAVVVGGQQYGSQGDASVAQKGDSHQHFVIKHEFELVKSAALASANMGTGEAAAQTAPKTALGMDAQWVAGQKHYLNMTASNLHPDDQPQQAQGVLNPSLIPSSGSASANVTVANQPSGSQLPTFILRVAEELSLQLRNGKNEIRIQLKPESLGRLEIRAESTSNGVWARIATESSDVKSYLENNLHVLRQAFHDQGLKIERIQILLQETMSFDSSFGFSGQDGSAGSGQNQTRLYSMGSGDSVGNPSEDEELDVSGWLALNPGNKFYTVA